MKDKDYIKELFSEKLSAHEVPVRSDLWSGIQSQIGNTAVTAAAKGISVATKWMIGIASSVIVTGSFIWYVAQQGAEQNNPHVELANVNSPMKEDIKETPLEIEAVSSSVASAEKGNISISLKNSESKSILSKEGEPSTGFSEFVSEKAPLIVLPAKEQNFINETSSVSPSTARENPKAEERKSDKPIESKKTESQNTKVVGEIAQWKKTNVFSPNGDGVNDKFFLENRNLKEFQITIYNNITKKTVFTSSDPDFVWFGENATDGGYGYVIIAIDENGNRIALANELMIAR